MAIDELDVLERPLRMPISMVVSGVGRLESLRSDSGAVDDGGERKAFAVKGARSTE